MEKAEKPTAKAHSQETSKHKCRVIKAGEPGSDHRNELGLLEHLKVSCVVYRQLCWKDIGGLLTSNIIKNISRQTAWWSAGKTANRSGRKMWRTKQYPKLDLALFSQLSIKPQHKQKPYKHWPTCTLVSRDGTASMGRFTQLTFRDALCLKWLNLSFFHQTNRENFPFLDVKTSRERP